MNQKLKIYLVGSFLSFRDTIIQSAAEYNFSDPRTHRQSCVLKLVYDDMSEAEGCPISFFVLPKGKRPGTMSYAEIGAAAVWHNHIIVVDENTPQDPLLKKLARNHFSSLDEGIEFLKTNPEFEINNKPKIKKIYPGDCGDVLIKLENVYCCGTKDKEFYEFIGKARELNPKKNIIISSDDAYEDFKKIESYDLIVANFPRELDWDRKACFMIGAAYPHDLPVILREDKSWRYPPLQALARRHPDNLDSMLEYITQVKDQHVSREALFMYTVLK